MTNTKLLGFVTIAFLAGVLSSGTVAFADKDNKDPLQKILTLLTNFGTTIQNLQTTDNAIKAKTDNLPSDIASNSHVDAAIASIPAGASQVTVDGIKAKTDNLPSDPASNSHVDTSITNAQNAINAHVDTAISSIPVGGGITSDQYNTLKCNATPRSHVDLSGCNLVAMHLNSASLNGANLNSANLSGADLSTADLHTASLIGANLNSANLNSANLNFAYLGGADFTGANLSGVTSTGCHGTPVGIPASGTLPVCGP